MRIGTHPDVCVHNNLNLYPRTLSTAIDYQQCTPTKGVTHVASCINGEPDVYVPDDKHMHITSSTLATANILLEYMHMGRCTCVCRYCGATFWESEKNVHSAIRGLHVYNRCCHGGRLVLRPPPEYPQYFKTLYADAHFMENIRAYNQMFSMTSLSANIDCSISNSSPHPLLADQGTCIHTTWMLFPFVMFMETHPFFVTFTCNDKWPEIQEYMEAFPELTTTDRADIVDRVFKQKGQGYVKFVQNTKPFGDISADTDIDKYISVELLDPIQDPDGHGIIAELMMYGPCGYANENAACIKDGSKCNQNFPKPYSDNTYIDKDGFVHYRRRATAIDTERQGVLLDNSYVVLYNQT
nr:DNA helicase [Tanacetum cinerariifolium]